MADSNKNYDWLVRGVFAKLGHMLDLKMGREPEVRSNLATSEVSDRLRAVLDANAREVPGKGIMVPHNIQLKMQWDKFSDESEEMIQALETELTVAAVDHINDSLYRTFVPVKVRALRDYFTEDVKIAASFEEFEEEGLPLPANETDPELEEPQPVHDVPNTPQLFLVARIQGDNSSEREIEVSETRRVSIGRAASSSLMIDDASVSKIHATVAIGTDGDLSVADTGSTNGTFIQGERIAFGVSVPFRPGDTVTFGTVDVEFSVRTIVAKETSPE
jgi:hypothetical protein